MAAVQAELARQVAATRKSSDSLAADKQQVQRTAQELELKEEQLKAWKLQTKAEMQQQGKVCCGLGSVIVLHCWLDAYADVVQSPALAPVCISMHQCWLVTGLDARALSLAIPLQRVTGQGTLATETSPFAAQPDAGA